VQLLLVGAVAFAGTFLAVQVTQSAGATSVKTIGNRIVVPPSAGFSPILAIPGLGEIRGVCDNNPLVTYVNTTSGPVDVWNNHLIAGNFDLHAAIVASGGSRAVASFDTEGVRGGDLRLGKGSNPGARKTASVTVAIYQNPSNDWCGFQATAVTWSHS
jgi:hypothetical protein